MPGLDPRLSGSALCCSYTKVQKTPVQPLVFELVPATHVFERGFVDGQEVVDGRDEPGQGDLKLCRARYTQPVSLNRTARTGAS
jgi:hypothetical protein